VPSLHRIGHRVIREGEGAQSESRVEDSGWFREWISALDHPAFGGKPPIDSFLNVIYGTQLLEY
jgi:hypothetical protein